MCFSWVLCALIALAAVSGIGCIGSFLYYTCRYFKINRLLIFGNNSTNTQIQLQSCDSVNVNISQHGFDARFFTGFDSSLIENKFKMSSKDNSFACILRIISRMSR